MKELWHRLEKWHREHAPEKPLRLRAPASEKAIAAAERVMGMTFPADFRASLLVHDGEDDYDGDPNRFDWMPGCDRLAPVAQIVAQWKDEQERVQDDETDTCPIEEDGRFRNVLWHSKRIPIAGSPYWDGDNTYLNLVPGPKGTSGQLVTMVTECDFTVLAPSFRAAFAGYVELLESGVWSKTKVSGHSADVFAKLLARRGKARIASEPAAVASKKRPATAKKKAGLKKAGPKKAAPKKGRGAHR